MVFSTKLIGDFSILRYWDKHLLTSIMDNNFMNHGAMLNTDENLKRVYVECGPGCEVVGRLCYEARGCGIVSRTSPQM